MPNPTAKGGGGDDDGEDEDCGHPSVSNDEDDAKTNEGQTIWMLLEYEFNGLSNDLHVQQRRFHYFRGLDDDKAL